MVTPLQANNISAYLAGHIMVNKSRGGNQVIIFYHDGKMYANKDIKRTKKVSFDDLGWVIHNKSYFTKLIKLLSNKYHTLNDSKKSLAVSI